MPLETTAFVMQKKKHKKKKPSIIDLVLVLSLNHPVGLFVPLKLASPSFPRKYGL